MADDKPPRSTQCCRSLAQSVGHEQQHVLGSPHDDGNDDDGKRHGSSPSREMAHLGYHDLIDEETDHDRGCAQENVVDETNDNRELRMTAVFGHISSGEDAKWRAEQYGEKCEDEAANNRIKQAAG